MKIILSSILITLARYRRRRGLYNKKTLTCFYHAYRLHPSIPVLLSYARFRRDLGYRLAKSQAGVLLAGLNRLKSDRLRQAVNLLFESDYRVDVHQRLDRLPLRPLVNKSPPLAALLLSEGSSKNHVTENLAKIHMQQATWREEFADYLRNHKGSICTVGNAGSLIGSALGEKIDAHDVVIRFNLFSSGHSNRNDSGQKITVWSCAPNCTELFSEKDQTLEWSILSGPDVRYQMSDWKNVVSYVERSGKVLTVPLAIWRNLVDILQAPPSAGVLVLAWLIELLESPKYLTIAGFDLQPSNRRYHQALPKHKAVQRHNWSGEQQLLRLWRDQGLRLLGDSSAL